MWQCPKCGRQIRDSLQLCWICGTSPDGSESPGSAAEAEPAAATPRLRRGRQIVPLAVLIAVLAIFDLLLPGLLFKLLDKLFSSGVEYWIALLFGALAGQLCLLAVWAVLGPQGLIVRQLGSLAVLGLLYGMLALGLVITDTGTYTPLDEYSFLPLLPLLLLSMQLPLWLARLVTGGRIVFDPAGSPELSGAKRQFSVRHLLIVTTLVAVAFGLARMGLADFADFGDNVDTAVWISMLIACLVAVIWTAVFVLPGVWAAMVFRNLALSLFATAVYVVLMSLLIVGVIVLIWSPGPYWEGAWGFTAIHAGLMLVLFSSLRVLRACGYALVRARRGKP